MTNKKSRAEQNREKVKKWRAKTKERITLAMGAKCQCCGYNKCRDALEIHHLIPSEKEIAFGDIRKNPISWERIVVELRKCVMLCSICHREVHAGMREIPKDAKSFDEKWADYSAMESKSPILI